MSKLICIGEVLIDFIPNQKGLPLHKVTSFERVAGGAPANVAACNSKLGGNSVVLSKVGMDSFGDYLIHTLSESGVNTNHIKRTKAANTGLAFVSLKADGDRDFMFYRNPSADMLLEPNEIKETVFQEGDILHFCSVDLIEAPVKYAHKKAIEIATKNNCLISFDPNVRLPLWNSEEECKNAILEFIPYADILKVSEDELPFITGIKNTSGALSKLFVGRVKLVILTKGRNGVSVYTKGKEYHSKGFEVYPVDTTGAGDAFIGAFLYQILQNKLDFVDIEKEQITKIMTFSNAVGAIVTTKKGAISSMPTLQEVEVFINDHKQK